MEFFKVTTTVQNFGDVVLNIWHRTRSDGLIGKSQETYKTVVDIYSLFTIVIIIVVLSIYYGRQQSLIYFLYIIHPYCNRATINYAAEWKAKVNKCSLSWVWIVWDFPCSFNGLGKWWTIFPPTWDGSCSYRAVLCWCVLRRSLSSFPYSWSSLLWVNTHLYRMYKYTSMI